MNTNIPQVARPTNTTTAAQPSSATTGGHSSQSKPAYIPSQPAAAPIATKAPAPKAAARKPAQAKKPAAKKAASAAKKPAAAQAQKPQAQSSAKPFSFANNNSKSFAAGSEAITNLTQKATAGLNEAIAVSKENLQAAIESANNAASISKSIGAELHSIVNQAIAQNTQAVQKFLSCRTASDLVNLTNSLLRSHADSTYSSGLKIAELASKFAKIGEPINARIASATHSFTKNFGK